MHDANKLLPDFSWAAPLGKEALQILRDMQANFNSKLPEIFWGGFWYGFVTAAVVLLVLWTINRK